MLSRLGLKNKLYYGWVVVATFVVAGVTMWGIRFSFGVFFKSIETEFELSRAATSTIFSTYMFLGSLFAILAGWILDKHGPRALSLLMGVLTGLSLLLTSQTNTLWQLYLTYSLLLSIGTGATYIVTSSTVSRWFDKKRGLALGISSSGIGLGTVVMAPLATLLISSFDWRMAYIIMGFIAWAVLIPLSRLLKKDPYEIGALPDGAVAETQPAIAREVSHPIIYNSMAQVLRTDNFWLIAVGQIFLAFTTFLVLTHLVPHITDIGFSAVQAAGVLSLIGGVSTLGRVLMGVVSDRMGRKRTAAVCASVQALALLMLVWSRELWMLYILALVYGFCYGGFTPAMAALIVDTFGVNRIGAIMGILEIGFGIGAATGPIVGGRIFDVSHSYSLAFIIAASAMFLLTLSVTLIGRRKK